MSEVPFKICPCCATVWQNREDFLEDSSLEINGYAPDFDHLLEGLFFFTHHVGGCFSTMTLKANTFAELYIGMKYQEHKTADADCPRYCFNKEELRRCEELCECAYVREIVDIIRQHPKKQRALPEEIIH
ncbi:MAG: hypothetical protein KKD73_07700 [Proteobacteria bacterium]|nr:hypothetical protein [Pseudomonadota bacterium]MBU1639270.1 hypothetical protein [Pseudomonadota bacterium]